MFSRTDKPITRAMEMSKAEIIDKLDQLAAWRLLLGFHVDLFERFALPPSFRLDKHPGCWLEEYRGMILLKDFGHRELHGMNVLSATMHSKHMTFTQALIFLYNEIIAKSPSYSRIQHLEKSKEFKFYLDYEPRPFNITDKNMWEPYGISSQNLRDENVAAARRLYYNTRIDPSRLMRVSVSDPCYVINIDKKKKAYRPTLNGPGKWMSTFDETTIGGNSPIKHTKLIFVTKSYKDYQVIVNLGFNCRYIHSESVWPAPEFIFSLMSFDTVIFLMDNDLAGHKAAVRLAIYANTITGSTKFIPAWPDLSKDTAQVIKDYGYGITKAMLQQI